MLPILNKINNRFLRVCLILAIVLVVGLGLIIAFISPISKYLIEKNGEKILGRQISLSWIYVNPFTGYLHAHDMHMREKEKKDTASFISIGDLSLHISLKQLWSGTIDVSSVTIDHLHVNVIENKAKFNFDDLFKKDSTALPHKAKKTPHYYVHNILLLNSEVQYKEVSIPVHFWVSQLNVQCPTIQWDSDTASFNYHLNFMDKSGVVKGLFSMNFHSLEYHFHTLMHQFDLKPLDQYIKEFSNYENFAAMLNADFNARGHFQHIQDLLATGKIDIDDFHYGKNAAEDYLRFSKLTIDIDSLSPLNKKYFFKKVLLDSVYVKYERYDSLDNFTRMIGKNGKNVSQAMDVHYRENIIFQIAHYISSLAADIVNSDYRASEFQLTNAHAVYGDYALQQSFIVTANPIQIVAHNVDTRAERLDLTINTKINPFGTIAMQFNADPGDFGNFNLSYQINQLPVPFFNPYTITYTSYPFDKGTIKLQGTWDVKNKIINSQNHILVINPTLATRVKSEDASKKPMRIVMFLVRELNREIDISLPIKGDLNNPKFKLHDEIIQVLKNIVIKPSAYPFVTIKSQLTEEPVNVDVLEWKLGQTKLDFEQKKLLRSISRYLFFHPSTSVSIVPRYYEIKEKETLLLFEAKRRFYISQTHINKKLLAEEDSTSIDRLSIKDPVFTKWLNNQTNVPMVFTVQGKCLHLIGAAKLDELYKKLIERRKNGILEFLGYLKDKNRLTCSKVAGDIPACGFSQELIHYKDK
jgi:hypothetical protein